MQKLAVNMFYNIQSVTKLSQDLSFLIYRVIENLTRKLYLEQDHKSKVAVFPKL